VAYYALPELAYDYSALEPHLSGRILELHHDQHHKAYVDGANKVLERLQEARATGDFGSINLLEKNLAFHLSGHILHSLFWSSRRRTTCRARAGPRCRGSRSGSA